VYSKLNKQRKEEALDLKVLRVMEKANKSNYVRKFYTIACRMKTGS
jgi:hypothetical protein